MSDDNKLDNDLPNADKVKTFFLLPVKDLVVFPTTVTGVIVGREKSINSLNRIHSESDLIFVLLQKENSDNVSEKKLYSIGTICKVIQQNNGNKNSDPRRIIIEGVKRARLVEYIEDKDFYMVKVEEIDDLQNDVEEEKEVDDLKKVAMNKSKEFFNLISKKDLEEFLSFDIFKRVYEIIFYGTAMIPTISLAKKQELLELDTDIERMKKFIEILDVEISLVKIDKEISDKVDRKIMKHQKKIYLNEKLQVIKRELGDDVDDEEVGDIGAIRKKMKSIKLPEEAKNRIKEEIKKLEKTPVYAGEYHVLKNYIDFVLELPWDKKTKVDTNLDAAEKVLNRDHYGLEKIKERILEFLAVYNRKKCLPGQIICFVGPPGVGKTSLAKSIAEALNRKYGKISLGGVRDEAEIRGHRKTYVGSMPGRIISQIKKLGVNNPLILLDEVDKVGVDYKNDLSSALLEVLDPEQNKKFNDHFLEIDFDLSDVMFITTANDISSVPIPLRDRMEILRLSGYTEDEKIRIVKDYLVPKELELHGVKKAEFDIDEKAIVEIIRKYTFEAGVRNLEREIAKLIRKSLVKILKNKRIKKIKITTSNLKEVLGVEKFSFNKVNKEDKIGVSVGLAYTEMGGDLLNIETLRFSGNGKLITTGKLGEVMKESAQAAFSYVRSIADKFDIKAKDFNKYDFHLHVPEGATPKDGPSAGVAITASILSSLIEHKINRDVAMTGEISLTGKVMPIGGLKEKLLAALRGNIKTVVIPKENEKNLIDIPNNVKEKLKIIPVDNLEDALKIIIKDYN
ncbi:MAG: endopeptidase La [Rickettsiales bacterium]|jgi:ATP-dependent Lon protease|nr:endopeptidase La [Rickettsiales bacterium]